MENKHYTVVEVAESLGISKQTLIRYEKKGVFSKGKRNPINHWREYTKNDILKLKAILGRS